MHTDKKTEESYMKEGEKKEWIWGYVCIKGGGRGRVLV